MVVWLAQGMFSNAFYSTDMGTTWLNLPKPPYQPRHIELVSGSEAYMWHQKAGMTTAWFEYEKMDLQKDAWVNIAKAPVACTDILVNFTLGEHYCALPNGTLKTFKDNNWD